METATASSKARWWRVILMPGPRASQGNVVAKRQALVAKPQNLGTIPDSSRFL